MSTPWSWSGGGRRQVDRVGWGQKVAEMGWGTDKDEKGKKGGHTMTLPCPALSFPSPPSVFPTDCHPILIAYALPCLSYLLPPPLQPSLYYPFIDSLSFFPTQLWPAFNNI